jgi:hypothetical protein
LAALSRHGKQRMGVTRLLKLFKTLGRMAWRVIFIGFESMTWQETLSSRHAPQKMAHSEAR